MSASQSSARRRALVAFVLLTAAVSACDIRATAPTELRRAPVKPAAWEGDTLACGQRGWVVVTGVVVCNGDG